MQERQDREHKAAQAQELFHRVDVATRNIAMGVHGAIDLLIYNLVSLESAGEPEIPVNKETLAFLNERQRGAIRFIQRYAQEYVNTYEGDIPAIGEIARESIYRGLLFQHLSQVAQGMINPDGEFGKEKVGPNLVRTEYHLNALFNDVSERIRNI